MTHLFFATGLACDIGTIGARAIVFVAPEAIARFDWANRPASREFDYRNVEGETKRRAALAPQASASALVSNVSALEGCPVLRNLAWNWNGPRTVMVTPLMGVSETPVFDLLRERGMNDIDSNWSNCHRFVAG